MLVLACLFVSVSVSVLVLVFVFVFVFVFALAFVFVSGCLLCHACTLAQNAHSLDTLLPPFFFFGFFTCADAEEAQGEASGSRVRAILQCRRH